MHSTLKDQTFGHSSFSHATPSVWKMHDKRLRSLVVGKSAFAMWLHFLATGRGSFSLTFLVLGQLTVPSTPLFLSVCLLTSVTWSAYLLLVLQYNFRNCAWHFMHCVLSWRRLTLSVCLYLFLSRCLCLCLSFLEVADWIKKKKEKKKKQTLLIYFWKSRVIFSG